MREPTSINVDDNRSQGSINTTIKKDTKKSIYEILYGEQKKLIETLLFEEKVLTKTALIVTILRHILLISVPILSLSAPQFIVYQNIFNYTAGACSMLCIGLERFAKIASITAKSKNLKINEILKLYNLTYIGDDMTILSANSEQEQPQHDPVELHTPNKMKRNFSSE